MHKLLRSYRTWLALVGVGAAIFGGWWFLAPVDPLHPRFWTEPVVLRSIHMDDMPVVAVGGSRDGSRIAAACSKIALDRKRDPRVILSAISNPLRIRVVEANGKRSFQADVEARSASPDIDVDSSESPDDATVAYLDGHVMFCTKQGNASRSNWTGFMRLNGIRFSPDEARLMATGGWFASPGCGTGTASRSIVFLRPSAQRDEPAVSNLDGIGIMCSAWSPDGSTYAAVGIHSAYAKWDRERTQRPNDARSDESVERRTDLAVKVWDAAFDGDRRYDLPKAKWESLSDVPTDKIWDCLPIGCCYSSKGSELWVAHGSPSDAIRGTLWNAQDSWGFQLERIDVHDANTGKITRQFALPKDLRGPSNMTLVGHEREEVIILTAGGLWRKSVADTGEWRHFVIPNAGKLSCMKTTRDRKHLLVGDESGNAHCLAWP